MSYILEALKKSEQERELGQIPRLVTSQEKGPKPRPRWMWVVAGVLVINGLLLAGLLIQGRAYNEDELPGEADVDMESIAKSAVDSASIPKQSVAPAVVEVVTTAIAPVPAPTVPVIVPPEEVSPKEDKNYIAESSQPAVTATTIPVENQTARVIFADRPLDEYDEDDFIDGTQSPSSESEATPEEEQIPLWQELPSSVRKNLPLVNMDIHVYSELPGDRFVLINLIKYREGDILEEGPLLEQITLEGMVLSHQGERFRITKK